MQRAVIQADIVLATLPVIETLRALSENSSVHADDVIGHLDGHGPDDDSATVQLVVHNV